MHSYECVKYSGLGNSNWNCQVIYNSLVKETTYFDRTSHFIFICLLWDIFISLQDFISILFIDIEILTRILFPLHLFHSFDSILF
jgi:hypothetical protein